MSKRTISIKLSTTGVDNAIRELQKYETWLKQKSQELLKALSKEGVEVASIKFQNAVYDGTNDVTVQVEERDEKRIAIVAVGNATLFIEFGTGVKYPDSHPNASDNGMVRGEYGYKLGRLEKGWRYSGDPGTNGEVIAEGKHAGEVHTFGNPANMCMYLTIRELEAKFEEIVRRVFV